MRGSGMMLYHAHAVIRSNRACRSAATQPHQLKPHTWTLMMICRDAAKGGRFLNFGRLL
jgi:hypothetical protein